MRRHIPGLHSGQQDLVSNLDGLFLVRVERASLSLACAEALLCSPLRHPGTDVPRSNLLLGSPLLHRACTLEAKLVPSGLWLRHRTTHSGPGR